MNNKELISYQELLDLLNHKNFDVNNIGASLGKEKNGGMRSLIV